MKLQRFLKKTAAFLLAAALFCGSAPQALAAGSSGFTDVPGNAWYAEAVAYCHSRGLMTGTNASVFEPNKPMTRALLVSALYSLMGSKTENSAEFSDIPADSPYYNAVQWAVSAGVASGYDDGRFGTGDPVSREQVASLLWRGAGQPAAGAAPTTFADESSISGYAKDAVHWAQANGILSGGEGNRFNPKNTATRAQIAVILMKYARDYSPNREILSTMSAIDVMCAPSGIAAAKDGAIMVTDTVYKSVWEVRGTVSTPYAGAAAALGSSSLPDAETGSLLTSGSQLLDHPWAIVPYQDGWAVSDTGNQAVVLVRKGMRPGDTVTKIGGSFEHPTGLAVDDAGNLYAADTFRGSVLRVDTSGQSTELLSGLSEPMGLCWQDGSLYVAETGKNRILRITDGITETVAGSASEGTQSYAANQVTLSAPQGVAVGPDGTVYIADTANSAIRCVKNGIVSTLAERDRTLLRAADLLSPTGLLVQDGKLYICDNFSRKVFVLELP